MIEFVKNAETDDEMIKMINQAMVDNVSDDIDATLNGEVIAHFVHKLVKIAGNKSDELETLAAAYNDAQKEISDLKSHNDRLIKQIKRLERRSGKLGAQLLKCKNELRNPAPHKDDWKKYNKSNRSGGNE